MLSVGLEKYLKDSVELAKIEDSEQDNAKSEKEAEQEETEKKGSEKETVKENEKEVEEEGIAKEKDKEKAENGKENEKKEEMDVNDKSASGKDVSEKKDNQIVIKIKKRNKNLTKEKVRIAVFAYLILKNRTTQNKITLKPGNVGDWKTVQNRLKSFAALLAVLIRLDAKATTDLSSFNISNTFRDLLNNILTSGLCNKTFLTTAEDLKFEKVNVDGSEEESKLEESSNKEDEKAAARNPLQELFEQPGNAVKIATEGVKKGEDVTGLFSDMFVNNLSIFRGMQVVDGVKLKTDKNVEKSFGNFTTKKAEELLIEGEQFSFLRTSLGS
jgi:hypothetical protein